MFFFLNRVGHHSTSDDSSAYRSIDEISSYDKKYNPTIRLRKYMYKKGCWNEEQDEQWKKKCDKNVKFSLILNSANKYFFDRSKNNWHVLK